jgi:UDPglucose 6-dehydrogenase
MFILLYNNILKYIIMSFAIIGNGFVGKATQILAENNSNLKMIIYDIDPQKCQPLGTKLEDLRECDIIFICVPTPMDKNGRNHLGIVESVINELKKVVDLSKTHLVIRSTVLVGTSDQLGCYFMPEFLTEKNWREDFRNCSDWLFGLLGQSDKKDEDFKNKISNLWRLANENGNIVSNKIHFVNNKEAEMIKYFRNTFLAVKVSFCNEIYDYCQNRGVNYNVVREMAVLDDRIRSSHTFVPGNDGHRGFGGTCFPKDTSALWNDFKDNGVECHILKAAIERNDKLDRPEMEWREDKGRAVVE